MLRQLLLKLYREHLPYSNFFKWLHSILSTYFDIRGLAETIRYLFKYGEIEFEDVRIKHENWPPLKDSTPFGVLPILEHNGKVVGQSISIARYLGRKLKLAGENEWENLEIDAVVDTLNDMKSKLSPIFAEKDEAKKKVLIEAAKKDTIAFYLPRLEAIVKKNKGYFALGRLTWADFYFAAVSPAFDLVIGEDILASYPNMKSVREKVNALPAIKKWIEVRPKTDF
ncbi:hypothetical protein Zmor_007388 [Zophobas morio]|uniref:glutathione transferase n=1 Tax=Zophobas morio TaxID=2755281 RepID=A0AA38IY18_9CUCU|nr:hypothetical protein Zmor_007388 [Zophobas morio]